VEDAIDTVQLTVSQLASLPATVDLMTAARILGIGRSASAQRTPMYRQLPPRDANEHVIAPGRTVKRRSNDQEPDRHPGRSGSDLPELGSGGGI
jgi:hypothetical protein